MTRASLLRTMHCKKVIKRFTGESIEDTSSMKSRLEQQCIDNGFKVSDLIELDDRFEVKGTNRFVLKPKMKALSVGVLKVRSKDYIFYEDGNAAGSSGTIANLKVDGDTLVMTVYGNSGATISYELAA
tara:strand:- start:2628 stop:3011 length:384 start_codon:yes stop_codon:yes gene_type:complete